MESLRLDPSITLVIDAVNPGTAVQFFVDGQVINKGEVNYFHRSLNVPTYGGAPTQLQIPTYYDELISLSAWKAILPAGVASIFVHAYLTQGGVGEPSRVMSLFSGWVTDSNPISFPAVARDDVGDNLSGYFTHPVVTVPNPRMYSSPTLGMPFEVVGFRGTYTASGVAGNRNIGFAIDDGAGNIITAIGDNNNRVAGSVTTVIGHREHNVHILAGNTLYLPLPEIMIFQPWRFTDLVINQNAGDAWSNCVLTMRPYVNF